ncbi:hypothetical protein C8Q79DRAFT_387640 [Trametes meyenii]|nr:hypothetical protein C8Q79DRAFT_387640 [Trametes meyenii]
MQNSLKQHTNARLPSTRRRVTAANDDLLALAQCKIGVRFDPGRATSVRHVRHVRSHSDSVRSFHVRAADAQYTLWRRRSRDASARLFFSISEAFRRARPRSSSQRSDKRDGIYKPKKRRFRRRLILSPPLSSPLSPSVNFLSSRTSVATVSVQEIRMGRRPSLFVRHTGLPGPRFAAQTLPDGPPALSAVAKQCRRPPFRAIVPPSVATFSRRSTSRRRRFGLREGAQKHSAVS